MPAVKLLTFLPISLHLTDCFEQRRSAKYPYLEGLTMFAFVDETGHSGKNIFDQNETFKLGCLLSVGDISSDMGRVIRPFIEARNVGRLHANEWGEHELIDLGHSLIDTLTEAGPWVFNLMKIHKPYVAPTKFVDMIFDAGENEAVPGVWYWDEMHRHKLCLVTDSAMSKGSAKIFWEAYLADEVGKVIKILDEIEETVENSKESLQIKKVFRAAFKWARRHPDSFTMTATEKRKGYQAHSPNIIAFTQLFQAIHQFAADKKSPPERLVHDKQDEFRSELVKHYNEFGHIILQDGADGRFPTAKIADYPQAEFSIISSSLNFGLQAVDLLLWISQRGAKSAKMTDLKKRLQEREDAYVISRETSKAIVVTHMLKRMSLK